ncbi:MAG: hypothetical protein Q7S09_03180 [bacterium]|nr:hypothetical protein [bacterium]
MKSIVMTVEGYQCSYCSFQDVSSGTVETHEQFGHCAKNNFNIHCWKYLNIDKRMPIQCDLCGLKICDEDATITGLALWVTALLNSGTDPTKEKRFREWMRSCNYKDPKKFMAYIQTIDMRRIR